MSLHFLIDGYNLIKRNPAFAGKKLEDGRQALISFIEHNRPQGSRQNSVTIVFDGKPGMYGLPYAQEISIVFTEYESADDLIKYRVETSKNKKEIVVVTDDKQLMLYVRSLGSGVMSVGEFYKRTSSAKQPAPKGGKPQQKPKVITASFEHSVNQEFEAIWLSKKQK